VCAVQTGGLTPDTAPESRQTEPHFSFALQPSQSYLLRKPRGKKKKKNRRKRVSSKYEWVELPKHKQNERTKHNKDEAQCEEKEKDEHSSPIEAVRAPAWQGHLCHSPQGTAQ
jgi:hypothetical protein